MKKLLIGLGAVVVLLVVAVLVVPLLIPAETYKREIAAQVEQATGRRLEIAGPARLSLLPRLKIEAEDIRFANAPGGKAPDMAKLDRLEVDLALIPLLSGKVEVGAFVLVRPEINLEVDAKGRANWHFGGPAKAAPAEPGGAPTLAGLSLGDVRLVDGRITYSDARSGTATELSKVNLTLSLPDLESPFAAKGRLVWNGKTVDIAMSAEKPGALLAGRASPVEASLAAEPVKLGFKGSVVNATPAKADGQVQLAVPSVRALAAWAGQEIAAPGDGLGPLSIAGTLSLAGPDIAFENAKLSLDGMNGDGRVRLALGGRVPSVEAALKLDRLDLNKYLPPEEASAAQTGAPAQGAAAAPQGWSEEKIDLSGLKAVNAKLAFETGAIALHKIKIGTTSLKVDLKGGKLSADLEKMALYGGNGSAKLTVDAAGQTPALTQALTLAGVTAKPLLSDAADVDFLEGTASAELRVSTRGQSQRAMVSALGGNGRVKFVDGAIVGVNLAAMVRNVTSAFLSASAGEPQKTDFAELSGTFRIDDGVVRNDDLLLQAPLLRLTGKGTVSLPPKTMDYRLTPKVVGTIQGQGGRQQATGVTVPVIVSGPWHDLSYKPDLSGIVEETIKEPGKALDTLRGLKPGGSGGSPVPEMPKSPGDVLKGLIGR